LDAAEEVEKISAQALGWLTRLVDQHEPFLSEQIELENHLPLVAAEQDNLRQLLAWGLAHEPQTATRLAGGLWSYWDLTGQYIEGDRCLTQALAANPQGVEPATLARAVSGAGTLAWRLGDFKRAAALHEQAANLYHQTGDERNEVFSHYNLAVQWSYLDVHKSQPLFETVLWQARAGGHIRIIGYTLIALGLLYQNLADFPRAKQALEESLLLCRQTHDAYGAALVLHNLGELARWQALPREALSYYQASNQTISDGHLFSVNSIGQGHAFWQMEAYPSALAACQAGVGSAHQLGAKRLLVDGLECLVLILAATHSPALAVRFAAAAARVRQGTGYQHKQNQDDQSLHQALENLRARLSPLDFDLAWQSGWHAALEQTIADALALRL
jgi:tetratricopeptide (TPR) repeat protein